jgi:hypothetical protein
MRRKKLYLILILLILVSCQSIFKIAYGIKNPKPKSEKQIKYGINKFKLNNIENHYSVNVNGLVHFSNKNDGLIDILFFNCNGREILPKDSLLKKCNGKQEQWLKYIGDSNLFYENYDYTLDSLNKYVYSLSGNTSAISKKKYTIVFFWASYAGKLNKAIPKWVNELHKNDIRDEIALNAINMDIRTFWDNDFLKQISKNKTKFSLQK